MVQNLNSRLRIFTIILSLGVFLSWGGHVAAWGEEAVVLSAGKTVESSSPPAPWTADYIRKRPYLIYSGNNKSMTVLWQTYQTPSIATLQWGTTTSYGNLATVSENGNSSDKHQFSYTIPNLTPGTKYYYRVTDDNYTHDGSFVPAPPKAQKTLSFYGYGDSRPEYLDDNLTHQNNVLGALLSDMNELPATRQTLLVHLGDYVWNGLNEFLWDLQHFNLDSQWDSIHTTFANLPFMGVLGNHEGYDAYAEKKTVMNYQNIGQVFRKYYPYKYPTKGRYYYSFDYGPVHFVIIDTWSYEGANEEQQTIGIDQVQWLTQDLSASNKPWKIAMIHTPIWQCIKGIHDMQAQLTPILWTGGVHLVLQGHSHYYSHAETEGQYGGMTFLTLGGGGAPLDSVKACEPDEPIIDPVTGEETNKKFPPVVKFTYHFARFDISGGIMTVTVIDEQGNVIDGPFQIKN